MANKKFKCPYCSVVFLSKNTLYNHMIKKHEEQLGDLSPAHAYFNIRNNKTKGKCIICGKETEFNEKTEKYERICSERCRNVYREQFKSRMIKKYGKENLLNDPDKQKEMLANRKISGIYKWKDGKESKYVGSYEKDALYYFENILKIKSKDLITPSPIVIDYKFNGKKHFYIPDFYLIPYNLLIEVKGSNNHYQKRDYAKELAKDDAADNSPYNYIKIVDKKYNLLLDFIEEIKDKELKNI